MANAVAIRIARARNYVPPINITVTMATPTVLIGNTDQATATATNASGGSISLPAGTYSSSDPTNAPVNPSTGLVSPNAAITTATIYYTVTATNVQGFTSVQVISAVSPLALLFTIDPANYANDAAFRAVIGSAVTTYIPSFTITNPVSAGANQTVLVSSSAGVPVGGSVYCDTAVSGVREIIYISAVPDATHITATFANPHTSSCACSPLKGTGPSTGATFSGSDSVLADLITLDTTRPVTTATGYVCTQTFRQLFPGGTALTSQLSHYGTGGTTAERFSNTQGIWIVQYQYYDPTNNYPNADTFFAYGDQSKYSSGGKSYKVLNIEAAAPYASGRTDATWTSGADGGSIAPSSNFTGFTGTTPQNGPNLTTPFSDGNWYIMVMCHYPNGTYSYRQAVWFGLNNGSTLPKMIDITWTLTSPPGNGLPYISRIGGLMGSNCNQIRIPNPQWINRGPTYGYLPNPSSLTEAPPGLTLAP